MAEEHDQTAPYETPTPPPAPGQAQPAQPGQPQQPAAAYGQPQQPGQPTVPYGQQPYAPGQPANPYGQPMPGYYQQPAAKSGKAVAALVCGIFALLFAWTVLPGIVLGIVAIVLAVKAVKEAGKDGKATGGKVCGIIGIVLSVLSFLLYLMIGFGVLAYVSAHPNSVTVTNNSSSGYSSSSAATDEEDAQAAAVVEARLDQLKSKDAELVQAMATSLDEGFSASSGYTLSELGVDGAALADWLLTDFDYQLDGAYTYDDGTGTVYVNVTMRDLYAFASAFTTDVSAFSASAEAGTMDEAAAMAKLGELLNAAMDKTTDTADNYIGVDVVKQGDAWVVDEESWANAADGLFGLY